MVVLALAAVLLLASALTAAGARPRAERVPYIVGDNYALGILSNGEWWVGKRRARQTAPVPKGEDSSADASFTIWAPTCSTRRQAVTFRRQVRLPGPPSARDSHGEGLRFWFGPYDPQARDIERYEVRLNGALAARETRSTLFEQPALDARLLHRGYNTISVVVVKKAGPCRSWDPRRLSWVAYRGVAFSVTGWFETDLQVGQQGSPISYTKTRDVRVSIGVRNAGPTEVPRAHFELTMYPRPMETVGAGRVWARFSSEGAVSGCADVQGDSHYVALECDWPDFAPRATGNVVVELKFLPTAPSFYRWDLQLSWKVSIGSTDSKTRALSDSNERNNSRVDIKHVFCGPLARERECANAP